MVYHLILAGLTPDLASFGAALQSADPAALMDIDQSGQIVRISTSLDEREIAVLLAKDDPAVSIVIERQPSNCCGGCGG